MADVKISDLPAAASVSNSDVLVVNQGSTTRKATVAQALAGTLTTAQIAGLTTSAAAALATTGVAGLSNYAARADHQHPYPTPVQLGVPPTSRSISAGTGLTGGGDLSADITLAVSYGTTAGTAAQGNDSRLSDSRTPSGSAGGDLSGTYPNPTLAAITTAQSNVGSGNAIPVLSTDAKGRVTALTTVAFAGLTTAQIAGLATTAPASLATTPVAGLSTFAARADHQHVFPSAAEVGAPPTSRTISAGTGLTGGGDLSANLTLAVSYGTTAGTAAQGNDSRLSDSRTPTGAAGGDLTGTYPNPTLAAITTAQANVGSASVVPVLSIDAKGRVTALTTTAISASSTSAITALTGDVTATGPGSVGATLAAITTAQSNVGSSSAIPVLSIDAKGRVTALATATAISATDVQVFTSSGTWTKPAGAIAVEVDRKSKRLNSSHVSEFRMPSSA